MMTMLLMVMPAVNNGNGNYDGGHDDSKCDDDNANGYHDGFYGNDCSTTVDKVNTSCP